MIKPAVLVLIPIRPTLCDILQAHCYRMAGRLPAANPELDMTIMFDSREMIKFPGDNRPWSRVARVRNRMLKGVSDDWDFILWIDADVVQYDPDLPTRFIKRNPDAIQAPMVLVEGTERFYDTCAFIIKGQSHIYPDRFEEIPGRNLAHNGPPYWPGPVPERVVEMDCVGTLFIVPRAIYRDMPAPWHTNHPAFTDHFELCKAARESGRQVLVDRDAIAYHADLPKYGEAWH